MQTSNGSRNGSSQRTSPANPRSSDLTKDAGSESDLTASLSQPTKSATNRSPKVILHRTNRSPVPEKKRPSRVTELECHLAQLQEDLQMTKKQLSSCESGKRRAREEAEEAKKQLLVMSSKFEYSRHQLEELAASEEARIQELRKISQDRDRAWQSELEAIQNQRSMDSAALNSATNEIHKLKMQLEMAVKSEAAQATLCEILRSELETLKQEEITPVVENLQSQLRDSEQAEAKAQAFIHEIEDQLATAKTTIETLRSDGLKLTELYTSAVSELEESRGQVKLLQAMVQKFQADESNVHSLGLELENLRLALEETESKYQEEQIKSMVQVQSANELVGQLRSDYGLQQANLESELEGTKVQIVDLKAKLLDKEAQIQGISNHNKNIHEELRGHVNQLASDLHSKLAQSIADITELNAKLMDRETTLRGMSEENEKLKLEIGERDIERQKNHEASIAEVELVKASKREAVMRLESVTEEADKSSKRAAMMAEQLDAAQASKLEMEAELRLLKVHSEQWRKAAEAAAAVLTTGSVGNVMERSSFLDSEYNTIGGKLMSSPFSDDMDDESMKKKNNYVLRRIGGLWKKGLK